MDYTNDYLSKMMPGFEKQPKIENSTATDPNEIEDDEVEDNDLAAEPVDLPAEENQAPEPSEMLNEIVSFLRRYLVCDDHQLTLLALWSLHTWCYPCFRTTPYLDVRSPVPQSGKSRCLKLLVELSASPAFATGADARTLMDRLLTYDRSLESLNRRGVPDSFTRTILLDNCHHTFSPSERQPLLALFNSGSDATSCYPSGRSDYYLFGPKAFAGQTPLPRSLAGRCIPIILQRKKPSDAVTRFEPSAVREAGVNLACWMDIWAQINSGALAQAAENAPPQLPSNLTPLEQDCVEPLLHIADLIGGPWPQRARAAVAAAFSLSPSSLSLQLLSDIREIFHSQNNPDHLPTRELLARLIELEYRPWSAWTSKSGQKLATILHDFGIASRGFHYGDAPGFRGYLFQSFADSWARYLPSFTVCSGEVSAFEPNAATINS
jgi:hypothetical protein